MLTNQRGNNIKQQLGIQQEKNDATAQDYGEEIKEWPVTCTTKTIAVQPHLALDPEVFMYRTEKVRLVEKYIFMHF